MNVLLAVDTTASVAAGLAIGLMVAAAVFGIVLLACILPAIKNKNKAEKPEAAEAEANEEAVAVEGDEACTAAVAVQVGEPAAAEAVAEEGKPEKNDGGEEAVACVVAEEDGEEEEDDVEDNESEEEREARIAAISSAPELESNQRYNRSFAARLIQSSDTVKEWYAMIKDAALSYKGTRSSSAWRQEKLYKGRALFVKLAIRGRTLCVYFPLNVGEVKNIEVEDVSDKPVHAATPALFRIKKDVHAQQALELVAMSAEALGLEAGKAHVTDKSEYALQTTEQLIEAGLVKLVTVKK